MKLQYDGSVLSCAFKYRLRRCITGNHQYAKKRKHMLESPSNFPLTTSAFQKHEEWTPRVLEERQSQLLAAAARLWELRP